MKIKKANRIAPDEMPHVAASKMRRHIWGYSVCPCPIKRTPGLLYPGIYAEGYIVFVFPFVCSFVLPSVAWNLCQSFALKFFKCCISQQLLIRKNSYLDHSYAGGLAVTQ